MKKIAIRLRHLLHCLLISFLIYSVYSGVEHHRSLSDFKAAHESLMRLEPYDSREDSIYFLKRIGKEYTPEMHMRISQLTQSLTNYSSSARIGIESNIREAKRQRNFGIVAFVALIVQIFYLLFFTQSHQAGEPHKPSLPWGDDEATKIKLSPETKVAEQVVAPDGE